MEDYFDKDKRYLSMLLFWCVSLFTIASMLINHEGKVNATDKS
jgi:hypothetical protein